MNMKKKKKKWNSVEVVAAVVLTILAVVITIPFWNAVVISFESSFAYAKQPFSWWPQEFTLENYQFLVTRGSTLIQAYKTTVLLVIVGTLAGMTVSVMVAYGFSRSFPGKKLFFKLMLFTMYFGGGLVPTYLLVKNLKLLDTYAVVILLSLVSAYNIIIMKSGFESVPAELQESAMIDGATDLRIFANIMLPLQKPLIATFSLFTMVGYWNTWYTPLIYFNSDDKIVLQLFLRAIVNNASSIANGGKISTSVLFNNTFAEGIQMATVFVVILPIMLVYPFLQKYFVKGVMIGAVKM